MTDQTEREVLTLRYIESQPDSGPHKPAMPGHIAVERGIEVVARLPIPDGLAPSEPVTLDDVEMPPESLSERIKADSALFFAGVNAASATPRTVTTVETLEDVLPGIELTREFDVTEEDATIIGEYLVGLGYVLTPAIDPDNEALVEKVATLHAAGFVQPHLPTTDATVADAVRYFAESWRFKGKGLPDDMPDEHDEALDWCSMTLLAMLDRLSDDAPLGAECRNTGWLITAATCPRCKGSGRADSLTGASECAPCGGCGHVCDDLATVLAPALDPDDEALVERCATAIAASVGQVGPLAWAKQYARAALKEASRG